MLLVQKNKTKKIEPFPMKVKLLNPGIMKNSFININNKSEDILADSQILFTDEDDEEGGGQDEREEGESYDIYKNLSS